MGRFEPFLKPALHPELVEHFEGGKIMPVNIEISLTGKCNASCPWCFYKDEKTCDEIDSKLFMNFLEECRDMGVKAITWTGGGEPTLHPNFINFVNKVHYMGLDQGLITNGWGPINFDPTKFNWIRVSRSNLGFDEEKLKFLRKCKTLGMAINYNGNYKEINKATILGEKIGVDYVQVRPVLNTKGKTTNQDITRFRQSPLLMISDYKFNDAKLKHVYKKCEAFHFVPFLWENGDLDVCGYMRGEKGYNLGNIYKNSLEEMMVDAPNHVPVCNKCQVCCKNHELNKLIDKLRNTKDVNFI